MPCTHTDYSGIAPQLAKIAGGQMEIVHEISEYRQDRDSHRLEILLLIKHIDVRGQFQFVLKFWELFIQVLQIDRVDGWPLEKITQTRHVDSGQTARHNEPARQIACEQILYFPNGDILRPLYKSACFDDDYVRNLR